jgi:hypothetical protein
MSLAHSTGNLRRPAELGHVLTVHRACSKREKEVEVLADDLGLRIAEDVFGPSLNRTMRWPSSTEMIASAAMEMIRENRASERSASASARSARLSDREFWIAMAQRAARSSASSCSSSEKG